MECADYDRVAAAIAYLREHVRDQPSLDDVAAHVRLSPFHFQRLFGRWAGVTPKRFLQALTLELGKELLDESRPLLEVTDAVGLSSSSRLHDHFVRLEAMTPGEYRGDGSGLRIVYGLHDSPFGRVFVAQTTRGVCRLAFLEDDSAAQAHAQALSAAWPRADLTENARATSATARTLAAAPAPPDRPLSLHIGGTNFQIAVWRALLEVPFGVSAAYSDIARAAGVPRAVRAVGAAIGANPVAFLIPCHRVIRASGALGGYHWGLTRKLAIRAWERARLDARGATSRSTRATRAC